MSFSEAANKHLTPCTLELGGKSPAYIDSTANLEYALKRLCWGKFTNCGQICVAPDYVLCSKSVQEQMVPMVERIVREWYTDTVSSSPDYCRIVSDRHQARLQALLSSTKGKIVVGGVTQENDKLISPTVVTDVKLDDSLMKVISVKDILRVLHNTGRTRYLARYCPSSRSTRRRRRSRSSTAGTSPWRSTCSPPASRCRSCSPGGPLAAVFVSTTPSCISVWRSSLSEVLVPVGWAPTTANMASTPSHTTRSVSSESESAVNILPAANPQERSHLVRGEAGRVEIPSVQHQDGQHHEEHHQEQVGLAP